MGTKVQNKSYLPGYHPMIDLNENASSSWSRCYEDNMLSGHLCNGFMLRPVNGCSEYDKEMLKQTMLEHETIFRKQVYELHRLYRIQRELMDECQKKGLYRYSIQSDTSQSNSFSSQMPCEGRKIMWQMSQLPVANTSYDKAPFAAADDLRSSSNFLKGGSVQSGSTPMKNGVSLKDGELLDSQLQKFPRRMFDLQLPADVYMDSEDSERSGKKKFADSSSRVTVSASGTCSAVSEDDVKLTLSTGVGPNCKNDKKVPNSGTQNGLPAHSLADLNKPIKDMCFERPADSASTHILGLRNHSEENQGHKLSSRSSTHFLGLQSAFSKDGYGDEGSSSSFLLADKEEIIGEWPSFNSKNGQSRSSLCCFTPSLCNDNFPMSSETIQLKSSHGIVLPHQNKTDIWFRQKPTYGIETSGSTHLSTSNNSAVTPAPSMPASFSILPQTNSSSTASSLVSSCSKPVNSTSHIPIAVQALPCFNGSGTLSTQNKISDASIQNIGTDHEKWQTSRDSCQQAGIEAPHPNGSFYGFRLDSKSAPYLQLSSITFGKPNHNDIGGSSSYGNSICLETQKCFKGLQCTDVELAKDVNLNQAFPKRIRNDLTIHHRVICDLEQKLEDSSKGISCLRKRPDFNESVDLEKQASQMELGSVHGHSQLMSSSKIVAPESEKKHDKETGLSLCSPQGFASTLQVREVSLPGNEISDKIGSTRILGFRILDKVQQGDVSHQECSLTKNSNIIEKDVGCIDLTCDMKEHSSEKTVSTRSSITEKGAENISTRFRNHINLNAEVTCMDDPRLSEFSPKSEVAVQSPLPVSRVSAKIASDINLAVPISQSEMNIMSHQEHMPSSKTDSSQETEHSHDTLVREAAENIVAMSVDVHSHLEEITCYPLARAQWDSFFWFTEVVLSNSDNARVLKSGGDCGSESSDDDGLDFLEAMTLKLEEIKVEDCCCQQKDSENKKGEPGAASQLLMRPRRGHARRRRQRRDFQKDILPGLASLSRHEVTEDLQTIGGLLKASGKSWQPGLTRRNTGRNGPNYQAKGRRQTRTLAVTVSETQVIPPPVHPINTDPEVDGRNMVGWGRTTRRCRRPRCTPGNVSAPLT